MKMAIAGGGTGGHLFPGIAVGEEFLKRDPANAVLFIGTERGLESRIVPQRGFNLKTITVKGFKGRGAAGKVLSAAVLPRAFLQSWKCLRRCRADIVCGVGGYVSGPAVLAGVVMRIPAVIHEQNSFPGLSNRLLGKFVNRIFISYDESRSFFPEGRTVFTGIPLRQQILERPVPAQEDLFTVAVLGGSQGSHEINRAMATALPYLLPIKDRVRIIHQSGAEDEAMLAAAYRKLGFDVQVIPFIDDMIATYGKAHLLISRAGAATLAEIALCGRAAILIPYPFAANNHQEKNARVFVEKGAALMIRSPELSGERLAQAILDGEQHRDRFEQMGKQSRVLAQPQAAQMIVDICYEEAAKRKKNNRAFKRQGSGYRT